jgi:hypothetical protein
MKSVVCRAMSEIPAGLNQVATTRSDKTTMGDAADTKWTLSDLLIRPALPSKH